MITDRLSELVRSALQAAAAEGVISADGGVEPEFERPKRKEHGDWATNVALVVAKGERKPREIATALVERLPSSDLVERVEIAGPGFLNFHLAPEWLHDVVRRAARPGEFGRSSRGEGTKVNVEYVSSNPTGPINIVSGRHAAVGDALANLLEATGHEVTREFYWNDMGRQIELFGSSIGARYLQQLGVEADLPEDGYRGDYVVEIAQAIAAEVGDRYLRVNEQERNDAMRALGLERMRTAAHATLARFGTSYDVWMAESGLHESGEVLDGIETLRERGWIYEREGALFFRSTALGDDKDRVVVRANGQPTYFAADVAYLRRKFERGFDHLIYLWGPDHHGSVPRLLAAVEALGFARERVEVPIVQIVNLSRAGEPVRASKRAGVIFLLDELIDEVGVDAARYTFLTRSIDAPLDFDIELAKEQAPENPVYYVQYAHARICSILRRAEGEGLSVEVEDAPLHRLEHASEDALIRKLASYEELVAQAAEQRAPQKVCRYVEELASSFSAFYRDCRVVSEDQELSRARLSLCIATKSVIADALGLLGVSAPQSM